MENFVSLLRRNILSENPLFVSVLGAAGAVMFTRNIASALTAAVTILIVLSAATAAMYLFERFVGKPGAKAVFFSTAAAVTAICGAVTSVTLPSVWDGIGACYPLFPAGSLALAASCGAKEKILDRETDTAALVLGYDAAIVAVSLVRRIFGFIPFALTSGGALIIIGIAAAVLRAVLIKVSRRAEKNTVTDKTVIAVPDASHHEADISSGETDDKINVTVTTDISADIAVGAEADIDDFFESLFGDAVPQRDAEEMTPAEDTDREEAPDEHE